MKCHRCNGKMVYEKFYGDKGFDSFFGYRCIACGEIVDAGILENRKSQVPEVRKREVVQAPTDPPVTVKGWPDLDAELNPLTFTDIEAADEPGDSPCCINPALDCAECAAM